jgi:HAD superfamily hydrolase (TIGR01509 family)
VTTVIFDCDGTLVDSEPLARRAWELALEPYGYELCDRDFGAVMGLPYPRVHAAFSEQVDGLPDHQAFWPVFSGEMFELIDAALEPFDDAISSARALRDQGVRIAVASSSPRERLDRTLRRAGLDELFEVTVAGDEVEHGKPAPDMFLEAAARLGVDPTTCVAVEDSRHGVAAGLAAGMAVVGVCRVPGTEASLAEAHTVVETLTPDAILVSFALRAVRVG